MQSHHRSLSDAELVGAIKAALPLRVQITKRTARLRDKSGKRLTRHGQRLMATDVLDGGSLSGITLVMEVKDEVLAMSLTGLRIEPQHPLYKEIRAYQLERLAWLGTQQDDGGRVHDLVLSGAE